MKLYFSPGACSLSVRILLHEMNLNSEYIEVDLKTKKTSQGEDYFKINPKGGVPALLTDNNELLTENAAIQQYLTTLDNAQQLLPSSADFSRFRVLEWLSYVSSDVHKSFGPLFDVRVPDDVKSNIFIPNLKNKLNYIDSQLLNKSYLMGETFTLPDAYLFVVLRWLRKFKIDLKDWPNLDKSFALVKARQSVKQSLEEEGLLG